MIGVRYNYTQAQMEQADIVRYGQTLECICGWKGRGTEVETIYEFCNNDPLPEGWRCPECGYVECKTDD